MADDDERGVITYTPETAKNIPGRGLPSYFANQYHVLWNTDVVRLTFGTALAGEENATFHYAITLPTHVALQLAATFMRLDRNSREPQAGPQTGGSDAKPAD